MKLSKLQCALVCAVALIIGAQGLYAVHGDEFFEHESQDTDTVKVEINDIEVISSQNDIEVSTPETSVENIVEQVEADQVQEKAAEIQTPESAEIDTQVETVKAVENAPSTLEYGSKVGDLVCCDVGLNVPVYWSGQQSTINRKNSAICDPYRNLPWNGPALLADHNTQDFDALYDMSVGQNVYIETQWGTLEYQIDYVGHACCQSDYNHLYTDTGVDVTCTSEQLTMYTCYPRYSNAVSPDRYVVLATRTL